MRTLVNVFYDHMDGGEEFAGIRGLHPEDLTESRKKLYEFFSGWLGGPQLYMQNRGHPRLRMRHAPFSIGPAERDQWLACMERALDDRDVSGELRVFLSARFNHVANFIASA